MSRPGSGLTAAAAAGLLLVAMGCGVRQQGGPAVCADGHEPAPPDIIADAARLQSFQRKVEKLAADKKATPPQELRKQLSRAACGAVPVGASEAALTAAEIYARSARSVLVLGGLYDCKKCPRKHMRVSGGFVISPDGTFVTNYHVLDKPDHEALGAMTEDGRAFAVREVLAASESDDVAICRLSAAGEKFTAVPLQADAPVGTPVCVISHPESRLYTLTCGHVSRYFTKRDRSGRTAPAMAITAEYARGSSGCPVLDDRGNAIGMVSSTHPVYYRVVDGKGQSLQMVIRQCVPAASILKLLGTGGKP